MTKDNDKAACEAALNQVFAELLPMMERCGVTSKRATELLAAAQVRAMDADNRPMVEIGRVTGYSFKKVQDLRCNGPKPDTTDKVARVHAAWISDHTLPPELPHDPKAELSTYVLCERYGRDLTTPELVRALVDRQLARMDGNVLIRNQKHYVARELAHKVGIAGRATRDLLATAVHNMEHDAAYALPQMRIYSSRTGRHNLDALRDDLRRCAEHCHEEVRAALQKYEEPALPAGDEIGIGLYLFDHTQGDER